MTVHLNFTYHKELGPLDDINIGEVLETIDERHNFNGLRISANFASFPPFCEIDERGNPIGLMHDILKLVAKELNLTLEIQATKSENKDIWFRKYYSEFQ